MTGGKLKLDDVYGISRDVPLNYVTRDKVDRVLVDSLTRDKHIVIYGSSKQGKTCLRKFSLKEESDYIVVTCSNKWELGQLHSAILKAAGYTVEQSETRTVTGGNKISAKVGAGLSVPGIAHLGGDATSEQEDTEQQTVETQPLELDPTDVNDIITALKAVDFDKFIVLEDFHYLPEQTQEDFAVALKAFHESSGFTFIVVGVWLDQNRLIQYNGDLTGRVIAIDADAWNAKELESVISKGEELLNVKFATKFVSELVTGCFASVYIVQESCHAVCSAAGIHETQDKLATVADGIAAADEIKKVVDQQSARYNTFITGFAGGFKKTELEMYKWLIYAVLTADANDLEAGLTYNSLGKVIKGAHPEGGGLNLGNLTQSLQSITPLQVELNIKPIVLDYDRSKRRLNVVDRGFLVWLKHQDKNDLLQSLGLTTGKAPGPLPAA